MVSDPAQLTLAVPPALYSAGIQGAVLTLTLSTELGPTYSVEYKGSIGETQWHVLTSVAGTGAPITISDGLTNQLRLYRVHVR